MSDENKTDITFERSVVGFILDAFGWELDKHGYVVTQERYCKECGSEVREVFGPYCTNSDCDAIMDEDMIQQEYAPCVDENVEKVAVEDVGGIVKDENGDPAILRDNFCDIVDYIHGRETDV